MVCGNVLLEYLVLLLNFIGLNKFEKLTHFIYAMHSQYKHKLPFAVGVNHFIFLYTFKNEHIAGSSANIKLSKDVFWFSWLTNIHYLTEIWRSIR